MARKFKYIQNYIKKHIDISWTELPDGDWDLEFTLKHIDRLKPEHLEYLHNAIDNFEETLNKFIETAEAEVRTQDEK